MVNAGNVTTAGDQMILLGRSSHTIATVTFDHIFSRSRLDSQDLGSALASTTTIPCCAAGSHILTERGYVLVGDLAKGDRVAVLRHRVITYTSVICTGRPKQDPVRRALSPGLAGMGSSRADHDGWPSPSAG